MAVCWAIDLGTSNTTVCTNREGSVRTVHLPDIARTEPVTGTPLIPSAVCLLDAQGEQVLIGQKAIAYNWDGQASGFAYGFKRYLGTESQRPLARFGNVTITARDAAFYFLRELFKAMENHAGEPITDLTIAVPCGSYETYRAELLSIVRRWRKPAAWWREVWQQLMAFVRRQRFSAKGVTFRTVDEPVASALGYGVNLERDVTLIAFDFGAGSLEVAAVRMEGGKVLETGRAEVLAKQSLRVGGDDVDEWVLQKFVPEPLRALPTYRVLLKWEAERVKIAASSGQTATFTFRGRDFGTLDYHGLTGLLAERGLYQSVQETMERLMAELDEKHGLRERDIDEVLLEGGSTLLPEIRNLLADMFGREKIREWLPFESVARGACLFAMGVPVEDIIYHDYALRVAGEGNEERVEYELLIPRGTRYPTPNEFVVRYYAPARDGQTAVNLFICEVGGVAGRPVDWEVRGDGRKMFAPKTEGEHAFCICLNEGDEAIPLDPPGQGKGARLRVSFRIDADRWLRMTVHDLVRKVDLKVDEPVVRLR
jgi:molecular chaperone DnaK (HSP70)